MAVCMNETIMLRYFLSLLYVEPSINHDAFLIISKQPFQLSLPISILSVKLWLVLSKVGSRCIKQVGLAVASIARDDPPLFPACTVTTMHLHQTDGH